MSLPAIIWSPTNGVSIEDFCSMPMWDWPWRISRRRARRQRRAWNRAVREWKIAIGREHRAALRLDPLREDVLDGAIPW